MAVEESRETLYRAMVHRFSSLEVDQAKVREQLYAYGENRGIEDVLGEGLESDSYPLSAYTVPEKAPGMYHLANPYRSVLEALGHALFVYSPVSGEMLYWNKAAEDLYGYKKWEVIGECFPYLLADPEYHEVGKHIMAGLRAGQSWAGQFPFRKRCGELFMALVNKTPLYDDGQLIGVITVSSDGTVFNLTNSNDDDGRNQRPPNGQQPTLEGPPTTSSVLSLSREVRIWSQEEDKNNEDIVLDSRDVMTEKPPKILLPKLSLGALGLHIGKKTTDLEDSGKDESSFAFPQPSKLVSKVRLWSQGDDKSDSQEVTSEKPPKTPPQKPRFGNFAFRIGKNTNDEKSSEKDNESTYAQPSKLAAKVFSRFRNGNFGKDKDGGIQQNGVIDEKAPTHSKVPTSYKYVGETTGNERKNPSFNTNGRVVEKITPIVIQESVVSETYPRKSIEFREAPPEPEEEFPHSRKSRPLELEYEAHRFVKESDILGDREIRWEDLQMKEEIGQGSYAVVYRGIWNGSDVAVKLYYVNQYSEEVLLDHKKEINIMRKLRHPNVLLYMGAVYSREKIAMVTEFLPRGSLFKIIHKNNQALDLRRRLRIALDVAKGMNYLHRRNPPIIHRDLKSSNLLVDRNWTVKVGDFGLSKMKDSTFLSARSGRGTPQWMAPEVLRNERSNEKSDVFSFGVILWELMTRCIPWNNLNPLQVVGVVGFMDRRLEIPDCSDPRISSIIHDCWQSNVEERPSFEDIIQTMTDIILSIPLNSAMKDSDL